MFNSRAESSGRASRKLKLSLMGPAFIAAIGYIDPGNFATNIQAGASYGYQLLWVVVWANIMAMLIQLLSAKLGIATGKNLAEHIRDRFPRPAVWAYWVQAEIIAMATDYYPRPAKTRAEATRTGDCWPTAVRGGGLYRRTVLLSAKHGGAGQGDVDP